MSEFTIYGDARSTFVRTARMTAAEKGVPCRLVPMAPGAGDAPVRHPFGRIPVAHHAGIDLWECQAICRYLDHIGPGPALVPGDPKAAVPVDAWVSAACDYLYRTYIRDLVIPRLALPARGEPADEAAIAQALPRIEAYGRVMDEALAGRRFFAGEAPSLADLFVAPILAYVAMTPEGEQLLQGNRHLAAWLHTVSDRDSFAATAPG